MVTLYNYIYLFDKKKIKYNKIENIENFRTKLIGVRNKLQETKNLPRLGFTEFGLAMPDILKNYDDPIQSYRDYYHLDKATFASWKGREKPPWWNEDYADYEKRITA